MSFFGWLTLFVLWYYVDRVFGFPVNDIQMESNTMSHSAITLPWKPFIKQLQRFWTECSSSMIQNNHLNLK